MALASSAAPARPAMGHGTIYAMAPPFAQAVAAEPWPFLQPIFDYEARAMARGRLALLGDAAFVIRPHTAMGVAKAAGDALALAQHLSSGATVEAALEGYAAARLPVGRALAAHGRRLGARLLGPSP